MVKNKTKNRMFGHLTTITHSCSAIQDLQDLHLHQLGTLVLTLLMDLLKQICLVLRSLFSFNTHCKDTQISNYFFRNLGETSVTQCNRPFESNTGVTNNINGG